MIFFPDFISEMPNIAWSMKHGTQEQDMRFAFRGVLCRVLRWILSGYERNERHHSGLLDGVGQDPLMAGAGPVSLGRINLPLGIHESSEKISVLEVYLVHLVLAEVADLLLCRILG